MKKLWKRILAIACLAMMLLAFASCGDDKKPSKGTGTGTATSTKAPITTTAKPDESTQAPRKERNQPYEDVIEDDTVNDDF